MFPDLSSKPALWLGLRQTESLREALMITLNGTPRRGQTIREWLAAQDVPPYERITDEETLLWMTFDDGFKSRVGISPEVLTRRSNSPNDAMVDMGEERSGAGWKDPANFLVTSAFVRLLGASEQFELDVLKALFYYRPLGILGPDTEAVDQLVEPDVILEKPMMENDKQVYSKPQIWTWLRKSAENNVERTKILKNVFGIDPIPDGYKPRQRDDWYEKRNKIAHGRAGVKMKLGEYIEVDAFVAKAMIHISNQCLDKLKLIV
jgi:hypothetical protein